MDVLSCMVWRDPGEVKIDHPARFNFHGQAGSYLGSGDDSELIGYVFSVGCRRDEDGGAICDSAAGGIGGGDEPAGVSSRFGTGCASLDGRRRVEFKMKVNSDAT